MMRKFAFILHSLLLSTESTALGHGTSPGEGDIFQEWYNIFNHGTSNGGESSSSSSSSSLQVVEAKPASNKSSQHTFPFMNSYSQDDICYRTVRFLVDQTVSDDFELHVTRTTNGEEEDIFVPSLPYKFGNDAILKSYYENYRLFSVSLPEGSYTVDFIQTRTQQPSWPTFVLPRWDGVPQCSDSSSGYVTPENVTITEPTKNSCEQLIVNGDMRLGTYRWYHENKYGADKGGLRAAVGEGVDNSIALRYYNRYSKHDGPGQNLDTRCLHQNPNTFYEIELYFSLKKELITFICDPFGNDDIDTDTQCPYISLRHQKYHGHQLETQYNHKVAQMIAIPNNIMMANYNLVHGVFKVDESLHVTERLYMSLEGAHEKFDILIDNVSVKQMNSVCGGNLIRNGDFEDNGKFWRNDVGSRLEIQESASDNKVLKVYNMASDIQGAHQYLYVDKDCLVESDRYALIGKFRIEYLSDGTVYECDRTTWDGELECSNMLIRVQTPTGFEEARYAEPVAVSGDTEQGWSLMAGILTVTEKQANHDEIYIRLYAPHPDKNVYYDNISLIPIEKSCQDLVLNGDFEIGDSRFWLPSSRESIDVDISSSGAYGSQYSLMVQKYTNHSIRQLLDSRCFIEGQQFQINAEFRLLDATNLLSGIVCYPSVMNLTNSNSCPSIIIRGQECAGDDLEYLFWNRIGNPEWDPDSYNNFENTFVVGPELASCKVIYIEVGHYTHEGRVLLVDNIQISERITSPPTKSPTVSPTKSESSVPTIEPTVTYAPTAVTIFSCPSVGSPPINVTSGTIKLDYSDTLCTLTKRTTSDSDPTTPIPIAISYDNNPWEQSAGEFATSLFADQDILCYSDGCSINLPPLESGATYILATFDYSLSTSEEYARFLETATFGITQEQLNVLGSSTLSTQDAIANWVSDQMNTSTIPLTSHREIWRRGVNGRLPLPSRQVTVEHPCDINSRWRRLTFVRTDVNSKLRVMGEGPFRLVVNGLLRTIVDYLRVVDNGYSGYVFDPDFAYEICRDPVEAVGARFFLRLEDGNCVRVRPNPPINLDGFESSVSNIVDIPDRSLQPFDQWWSGGNHIIYRLNISLFDDPTSSATCFGLPSQPTGGDEHIFGRYSDGHWMIFDPRIELQTNTLDDPLADGGRRNQIDTNGVTQCSNVPRTFLNENECKLTTAACQGNSEDTQVEILLNNSTIAALNNITEHYVYAIKGLSVDYGVIRLEHPCTPGLRSRWEPKDISDCKPTELEAKTRETLFELLNNSGDDNPFLRDIFFPEEGATCSAVDDEREIEIEMNGECWTRVHPEHMSIFDMTYWVDKHPGGSYNIQKWSENNGTVLVYPSSLNRFPHGMNPWNNYWHKFTYIGRFGDNLFIRDLPNDLRGVGVTDYFTSIEESDGENVLICGSPGEVANDKKGEFQFDATVKENLSITGNQDRPGVNRQFVWLLVALGSNDQLRQRVSWALSQILVVVPQETGSEQSFNAEEFVTYYDIFVRNAFGNYRDILKEISYSPLMAENLSYLRSMSSAYMLKQFKMIASPDENFAREIMQLFSIGLVKLNMDGSPKLDMNGNTQLTYTNDEIESFSRAWTGFNLQSRRGNIEDFYANHIDPMKINADWRDRFPKTDTTGGYIGDKYPLCTDFPSKSFLRKGAKYRLLGSSNLPELMEDPPKFKNNEDIEKFVLDEASSLRSLLCNKSQAGICNFKNIVTLESNLDCSSMECDVDTVRVVKVDTGIFYEFVSPPCVTFPFYDNPVKISWYSGEFPMMCADPKLPVAGAGCCKPNMNVDLSTINSKYSGERMSFTTAQARCGAISENVCTKIDETTGQRIYSRRYFWNADSCNLQVKIRRDGSLTIVHKPNNSPQRVEHVSLGNQNFFKVQWEQGGNYPTVGNDCNGICEVLSEGACLCNTAVLEDAVFESMPSGKNEIIDKLHVGAVDPRTFDIGTYFSIFDFGLNITVHLKDFAYNSETIFEYENDEGQKRFLKNVRSSVHLLDDTTGEYTGHSFRNAPQFMSFIPSETNLRDAQYETEAVLDHYFFHDNTAPFLAQRLIQRLVMSNPGPRYIQTVAEAFKTGSYVSGGISFGSGKYGDLASTFAAIYLDRAARNVLLDKDISNGALREPILKVTSLMRSMEYVTHAPIIEFDDVEDKIGQVAYEFDSVFSFFLPEHKPNGPVGNAALVSPEATLLDTPKILGLLNGLNSMIRFGLSSCRGGLADSKRPCRQRPYLPSSDSVLEFNKIYNRLQNDFSFETFEGPSLKGGLDNKWVGNSFFNHNGRSTIDPLDSNNHVLYFPVVSSEARFFSPPTENSSSKGNRVVVKFRYLATGSNVGGCIGYVDGTGDPSTQTWALCDNGNDMQSNGSWISCQFVVPLQLGSFRIAITDRRSPGKDAYFDDIQIGTGGTTTCTGVDVPKRDPPGEEGYSDAVVDSLSTLLTAGRLGSKAKSIIADAFDRAGSADDGLAIAQQLIVTTPEFHTTNVVESTDQPRSDGGGFPQQTGKPYKALVYMYFSGGCDSFNMLVPHTCSNDLYEHYLDVRQHVAIERERLLPISASGQVCSRFGVHPALSTVKTLYDDEDLLFFANTGALPYPMTKDEFYNYVAGQTRLFAHNTMSYDTERLDPYDDIIRTGVLGRMVDVLGRKGYNTASFALDRNSIALEGNPGESKPVTIGKDGLANIYLDPDVNNVFTKLHNKTESDSGIFGDSWSTSLVDSVLNTQLLHEALNSVGGAATSVNFPNTHVGSSLKYVSRMIASREARGADVDVFRVFAKRFDTHKNNNAEINQLFADINSSLRAFVDEMKSMDLWNDVTVIQTSEFGRSLSPNGSGTDHGWGGNYMLMGGSVKGGQILGEYPTDFTNGPLTLPRGRMIPSTPWEAPFQGIAKWLGIDASDMLEVCPNLHSFDSSHLIDPNNMFEGL